MVHTSGDDKVHALKNRFDSLRLRGLYIQLRKQPVQRLRILFRCKIICHRLSDNRSYTVHCCQFLCIRASDFCQIIVKCFADHLCIGHPDIGNSQAVEKSGLCGISGFFDTGRKVFIGFFTKPFHGNDFFPVLAQVKDICKLPDKSPGNKFFQSGL